VDRAVQTLLAGDGEAVAGACGQADLLAGIPALNQARSIGHVVERVVTGLAKLRPDGGRAVVLVVDAGSGDGTSDAVPRVAEPGIHTAVVRRPQAASRARAILAILAGAHAVRPRACAVVDGGLESLSPDGLERLLGPILRGEADYVSPTYSHPLSEGTLTTNLLAPMAGALFGRRLQQLVGGCLALSPAMVARFFASVNGEADLAQRGVEVWLPLEALASDSPMAEAAQGRKVLDPGLAAPDVASTLVQVVGPFFGLLERYRSVWAEVRGSRSLQHHGDPPALLPPAAGVHVERMIRAFRLGLKDLLPLWDEVLPEEVLAQLYPLGLLAPDEFCFPAGTWAQVVYAFAVAYHERRLPREHLVRALTPLYLGRTAAFLREAQESPDRLPAVLEAVARAFEAEKDGLRARWR
jgi:hypothetical protein